MVMKSLSIFNFLGMCLIIFVPDFDQVNRKLHDLSNLSSRIHSNIAFPFNLVPISKRKSIKFSIHQFHNMQLERIQVKLDNIYLTHSCCVLCGILTLLGTRGT